MIAAIGGLGHVIKPHDISAERALDGKVWSPARPAASGSASPGRSPPPARPSCSTASASPTRSRATQASIGAEFGVPRRLSPAPTCRSPSRSPRWSRWRSTCSAGSTSWSTMPASSTSRRSQEFPGRPSGTRSSPSICRSAFHTTRLALPSMIAQQVGPHHQHRLGARAGRLAVQVGLCGGQARHRSA